MTEQNAPAPAAGEEDLWKQAAAAFFGEAQDAPRVAQIHDDESEVASPAPAAAPEPSEAPDAAPEPDASDPWADAPDALRRERDELTAKIADLEHKWSSDRSRVSAMQRKLNELTKSRPAAPPVEDLDKSVSDLAADFPEIGERLRPLAEHVKATSAAMNDFSAAQMAAFDVDAAEQEQMLERAHPGWAQFLGQHGRTFQSWVDDQPRRIRDIAAANGEQITDARAASELIAAFKAHVAGPPQPNPSPSPQDDRRARQLAGSVSPAPRSRSSVPPPEPATEEEIWRAANAYLDKQTRRL